MSEVFKFSNGVTCFIDRKTNPLVLAQHLLKKGVKYSELPPVCQRAVDSYWLMASVAESKRRAQVAVIVKMEMDGAPAEEIAERCGMSPSTYQRFRRNHKNLFRDAYEQIGGDARLETLKSYITTEQRLASVMPVAAKTISDVLVDEEVSPAVKARTSLELLKFMRQDGVRKRLLEVDDAFAELARETAGSDIILQEFLLDGEPIGAGSLPSGDEEVGEMTEIEVVDAM